MSYVGRGIATLGAAGLCAYWAYLTGGKSGVGWFVISLLII
jgi:hypothetical protein